MLGALLEAVQEASSDQVNDQVSDQVARLLTELGDSERSAADLMYAAGLSHKPTFRKNYLKPALDAGWIELTQPGSPQSPTQRNRLTDKGKRRMHRKKNA